MTAFMDMAPFVPREDSMLHYGLLDLASALNREAAKLTGRLAGETAQTIRQHMAVINSFYSNLIEGNRTLPHQIREAQRGDFSHDPVARDYQLESIAHIQVQEWIKAENPDLQRVCSPEFVLEVHERFYRDLPDSLRIMKSDDSSESTVEPGRFRTQTVTVGRHKPPAAEHVSQLITQACKHYCTQVTKDSLLWLVPITAYCGSIPSLMETVVSFGFGPMLHGEQRVWRVSESGA